MIAAWLDALPLQRQRINFFGRPSDFLADGFVFRLSCFDAFSFIQHCSRSQFFARVSNVEKKPRCDDGPDQAAAGVNTFYPAATACYVDPSFGRNLCWYFLLIHSISASCADFGSSGSGVVREWKPLESGFNFDNFTQDPINPSSPFLDTRYQYSFVGPLSMSKGCDMSIDINSLVFKNEQIIPAYTPEYVYRGNHDHQHYVL